MVELWAVSTGERFVRWPVDARAMIARGGYTTDQPANAEPVPASAPHDVPASLKAGETGPTGAPVVLGAAVGVRTFGDSVVAPDVKPQTGKRK